jgi:hypothetical protein
MMDLVLLLCLEHQELGVALVQLFSLYVLEVKLIVNELFSFNVGRAFFDEHILLVLDYDAFASLQIFGFMKCVVVDFTRKL